MKKQITCAFMAGLVLSFFAAGCGSTESEDPVLFEDGILIEILELVDAEMLDTIENVLEMPIHRGENPPMLDVTVVVRSPQLLKSNVPGDEDVSRNYVNAYSRFYNHDRETYTISFDVFEPATGNPPSFGPNSYIIGNGNSFSVFGFHETVATGGTVLILEIFSGALTNQGIFAPHRTAFMIDNGGTGGFIPNGTGRSFNHGLGLAEFVDWPGQQNKFAGFERDGALQQ